MTLPFFSRKSFGRYGSFSSLKRYTSKTSLISAYDFIKEKVVPDSMRKKPGRNIWFLSSLVPSKREKNIQTETTLFCKSKHRWLCPQKIYKLRQTKMSQFV